MADDHIQPSEASSTVLPTADDARVTTEPNGEASPKSTPNLRVETRPTEVDGYNYKRTWGELIGGWTLAILAFLVVGNVITFGLTLVLALRLGPGVEHFTPVLGALATLVLIVRVDRNFWLSRLFGIQTRPNSSPLRRVLFILTFGWVALLVTRTPPEARAAKTAAEPGATPKPQEDTAPKDLFREAAETVVFVIILVLLLKTFVAEAFVIPTGSMATTLWGYQKVVVCPECGFTFPVNAASEADPQSDNPVIPVVGCTCPNCRHNIEFTSEDVATVGTEEGQMVLVSTKDGFERNNRFAPVVYPLDATTVVTVGGQPRTVQELTPNSTVRVTYRFKEEKSLRRTPLSIDVTAQGTPAAGPPSYNPPPKTGDRVLVMKCLYDTGLRDPKRGDVVVFKFPGDENHPEQGPQSKQVAINYIKRLVGLPGETLAIHGGKLYVGQLQYPNAEAPSKLDHGYLIDARYKRFMYINDAEAVRQFESGAFHIVRKPPEQLLAMMRPVYDNDFQPKNRELYPIRWTGAAGWQPDDAAKTFTHAEAAAGETPPTGLAWLRYRHLITANANRPELITDFCGYNSGQTPRSSPPESGAWVGDLILESTVAVTKAGADDEVCFELAKGGERFRARFHLATGDCSLTRLTGGKEEPLTTAEGTPIVAPSALKGTGQHTVRFANVDERLVVWVDGTLLFGDGATYSSPEKEGPTQNDLEPASIGVSGAGVKVSGLKLWRDTYYTCQNPEILKGGRSSETIPADARSEPTKWGPSGGRLPVMTMYVQPGHYLCMGDNSPQSSDSRFWGLVPDRLMLGRALEVYFPFYLPPFLPVNRVGPID